MQSPFIKPRVVISGVGVVSPNGIGREAFIDACLAGKSGLNSIERIDCTNLKSSVVAQVLDFDPAAHLSAAEVRRVPALIPMAIAAAREAMEQAKLAIEPADFERQRDVGVVLGTGGGGLAFVEDQYRNFFTGGQPSLFSITAGTHGNLSSELSINLKLRGPSHVLSTGCTSSTDAIAYACSLVRDGVVKSVVVGGADSPINTGVLHAFEKMRVIGTRRWDSPAQASRPFSKDRDGFILGEGAWMFVVESAHAAEERGATPLAEIAGYGSTCDAFHRVQIAPDVAEPVRAMQIAMRNAGVSADEIDYVNLHGTGTDMNDRLETAAIHAGLGEAARQIPMSSTKSMIGHPQGACGAAGIAATVLSMKRGRVHPTINLDEPDSACDLDYVADGSRAVEMNVALCNCIAFGSKNSAMILRRW